MACFLEESRHAGRIRNGDDAREIKGALATFMVTISEGRGYGSTPLPIHAVYSGPNWDGVSYITDEDTELLVKWGELWYALYHWGQHPEDNWSGPSYEGPRTYGITSAAQALATTDVLKRPKKSAQKKAPKESPLKYMNMHTMLLY
jgi:hypothetical protein